MYVNVSSYWRPGFFFLFFICRSCFQKAFDRIQWHKWMFKMVFETSQCMLSYQFFLSGIFWFLLFSFVKHFVFFCLCVSSLRLILWTLKLLYERCWQEKINVKDVIKGLGNDIMQGNVCCVKHGIAVCKSEYDSLLWNWEHIKLLKLPATLLCVFKMLSKVTSSILAKEKLSVHFPGFQHNEILEAFSL